MDALECIGNGDLAALEGSEMNSLEYRWLITEMQFPLNENEFED